MSVVNQKNVKLLSDLVLNEFFRPYKDSINGMDSKKISSAEHEYLTAKYKARSEAGRKGGLAKSDNASSKMIAPIPIPIPIPRK